MTFSFVLTPFEKILNRYLLLDPSSKDRLANLAGKVIVLELQYINTKIYFLPQPDGIHLADHFTGAADVTLRGSPLSFLRLSTAPQDNAALFASGITVTGNTEIAQEFKALFANLDIDWEEQLSHFTGDLVAHQLGNFIRAISTWAKQTTTTLQQDLTEYLQEEIRWLPSREELQDFFAGVDALRDATDRAALRIEQLQKKISSTEGSL